MNVGRLVSRLVFIGLLTAAYLYLNGTEASGEKRYVSLVRKYTGQTIGPNTLPE